MNPEADVYPKIRDHRKHLENAKNNLLNPRKSTNTEI